jgi:hypothetical protein
VVKISGQGMQAKNSTPFNVWYILNEANLKKDLP